LPLAAYACRPDQSRGRLFEEPDSRHRTCFQRDRDRIIHCSAFRRLKYKTQVFVYHEGDHFRTRLTHTIEVAQIARTLARALLVNEDLAEAVALSHDLGHTPFAHLGEDVLEECMRNVGGFDHNDQSLRVLVLLEKKYPKWDGLNLTWETLEGVVKHNGPMIDPGSKWQDADLPITTKTVQGQWDLELGTYASVEAQAAAIADDIAYNNHDVEDGLRAGLFTLNDLRGVKLLDEQIKAANEEYPGLDEHILIYEIIRNMIGAMVEDVLTESGKRLKKLNPGSPDDVRNATEAMVAFSPAMLEKVNELRHFLMTRMYRHSHVIRMRSKVGRIVRDLYAAFTSQIQLLPEPWQKQVTEAGGPADARATARVVADYIAGMTDRYAIKEHEKLFDPYRDLR
jgi:dGTPase